MINIKKFCFNPLQTNSYVVNDENYAIIIDPCCYFDYEKQELDDYITSNNFKIEHILVTHMHPDHILGLNWCQNKYNVIAEGPSNENHWVEISKKWAEQIGYNIDNDIAPVTKFLSGGIITWGNNSSIEVLPTPGHSPGHLSYAIYDKYSSVSKGLFCGDVVFKEGIGRYDLADSNYEDLKKNIKLVKEAPSCKIYPGHGEPFSVIEDKRDHQKTFWKKLFGN